MNTTVWEYTEVHMPSTQIVEFTAECNRLGSIGWEICGFVSDDPTLGLNRLIVMMKRERANHPGPADRAPAWHPDPTGRRAKRYWDGLRWTEHVVDATHTNQSVDYPLV